MKICFATYAGVTITAGGPFVKINDLKNHLEKKGVKVDLFNLWEANKNLKEYDLFQIFGGNFAVYDLCRQLKSSDTRYVVNPIIFSKHLFTSVKIMVKTDTVLRKIINGVRFDYGYTKEICEWSDFVIPNTSDEADLIHKGLSVNKKKIRVIHNGVSEKFLNGNPDVFKKMYKIENFILFVGHLGSARKNGVSLVRALKQTNRPSVIIGKIADTVEGKKIKEELSDSNNIIIIDGLSNDSELLKSAYAACDTFVMPSWYETPGRSALEAALSGAKIVITPYGGTKDYFSRKDEFPQDLVEYINPYSVDSIRMGIEKSLIKPKDNLLKEHIRQNFLWDRIADDTIKLYSEVLKG